MAKSFQFVIDMDIELNTMDVLGLKSWNNSEAGQK
jgi:hypothetical protein